MITIREEKRKDMEIIREVNVQAFGAAVEADLVDTLRRHCKGLISLVAIMKKQLVGHILFSPAVIEAGEGNVEGMALGPMSVLPSFQRMGIGSELVKAGLVRVKEKGCPFVIVLGHAAYYPRFGFEPAGHHYIHCEWEVPDEAFMILYLDPDAMDDVSGLAKYRPEFDEIE